MFFNPQMMGQSGFDLPQVPTVKELWKREKTDYRHWVILFGIALLALFALSLVVLILNAMKISNIASQIQQWYQDKYSQESDHISESQARTMVITQLILPNTFTTLAFSIGTVLFATTIIKSYKSHSFARISQWATLVVGLAALMSAWNLIELAWRGGLASYSTSNGTGIFSIVFYILSILVWGFISVPLGRIRKVFIISENVERLQKDPQFQAARAQFEAMMKAAAQQQGSPMSFGPAPMAPTAAGAKEQANPNALALPEEKPERKRLEAMSLLGLKKVAEELSISGASEMKKDELIEAILRVTEGEE